MANKNQSGECSSYLQWRPVVYTTIDRDLTSSTDVHIGEERVVVDPVFRLKGTPAFEFYGHDLDTMFVTAVNVSIGTKGDGFYKKTNYAAW